MKKALIASIAANLLMVVFLLLMRTDHRREVGRLTEMIWKVEDLHCGVHDRSVSALESQEAETIEEVTSLLRTLLANQEAQRENRELIRESLASGEGEWTGPGFDR